MEFLIPIVAIFFVIGVPVMAIASHFVLRPLVRDVIQAIHGRKAEEQADLEGRLGRLEEAVLDQSRQIDRLLEAETFRSENGTFSCTLSLGIATFPMDGNTKARITECADQALYQAKRSGRNRSVVFGEKAKGG